MRPRVLHVLSQRPGRTGSGVTLEAWVREAAARGYAQDVVVGVPAGEDLPRLGDLDPAHVHPLRFGTPALPFPVPGMSDVMPYESSVWSRLDATDIARALEAWRSHLGAVVARARPDLVHAHHLWLVASLMKDVAPDVPLVIQSHATGLRQMDLCPHLADRVIEGCSRAERVLALSSVHAEAIAARTGYPRARIRVVGAGYREELFHPDADVGRRTTDILYVGKYSRAKGVPWLLEAFERVRRVCPEARLHLAGDAAGEEGRALAARVERLGAAAIRHGHLDQAALADLMRRVGVLVLPSLYEGLPLVLVEAAASGCRVVATRLDAVEHDLAPHLGDALTLVDPPGRVGVDEPVTGDLPAFVERLGDSLAEAVARGARRSPPDGLEAFTWRAAFARVEAAWAEARRASGSARGLTEAP